MSNSNASSIVAGRLYSSMYMGMYFIADATLVFSTSKIITAKFDVNCSIVRWQPEDILGWKYVNLVMIDVPELSTAMEDCAYLCYSNRNGSNHM